MLFDLGVRESDVLNLGSIDSLGYRELNSPNVDVNRDLEDSSSGSSMKFDFRGDEEGDFVPEDLADCPGISETRSICAIGSRYGCDNNAESGGSADFSKALTSTPRGMSPGRKSF